MVKVCITLTDESIAQLEALRDALHLSPAIKRSTLIQQVIFQLYWEHLDLSKSDTSFISV